MAGNCKGCTLLFYYLYFIRQGSLLSVVETLTNKAGNELNLRVVHSSQMPCQLGEPRNSSGPVMFTPHRLLDCAVAAGLASRAHSILCCQPFNFALAARSNLPKSSS